MNRKDCELLAVVIRKEIAKATSLADAFKQAKYRVSWSSNTPRDVHVPRLRAVLIFFTAIEVVRQAYSLLKDGQDWIVILVRIDEISIGALDQSKLALQYVDIYNSCGMPCAEGCLTEMDGCVYRFPKAQILPFIDHVDVISLVSDMRSSLCLNAKTSIVKPANDKEQLELALRYMNRSSRPFPAEKIRLLVDKHRNLRDFVVQLMAGMESVRNLAEPHMVDQMCRFLDKDSQLEPSPFDI